MLFTILFLVLLFLISWVDLRELRIPDLLSFSLVGLALVRLFWEGDALRFLLGGAFAFVFFFVLHCFFPRGIGFGDVKLSLGVGLFLGWPLAPLAVFLSFLFGALVGVALILFHKKSLKDALPFAPFLSCAAAVTLFFGDFILNWYLYGALGT
jgi:leader peptidase (prepilin peptidase)/N-methyltransferase